MKKIKTLSLSKEKIVNLNDQAMGQLKGGTGGSVSAISTYISGKVVDYTISALQSILQNNTLWVGCTTGPNRSKQYATRGCIAP